MARSVPTTKPLSLREYAKLRGVSPMAVSDAVRDGRLKKCVVYVNGQPKIADPVLADVEWKATTLANRIPLTGPGAKDEGTPDLAEARLRHETAKAALAEIDLAERRGELVAVQDVEAQIAGVFTRCRTRLLGVPARVRQRDPALTAAQIALIETEMRSALEELADLGVEPAALATA